MMYRIGFVLRVGFLTVCVLIGCANHSMSVYGADTADESLTIAYNYYQQKRYDLAIGAFETFLQKNPNHANKNQAEFFLAESLFQKGRPEEAFAHLDNMFGKGLSLIKSYTAQELDKTFYLANIRPKIESSLTAPFGKDALFRAGEIAYFAGDLENARKFLFVFICEFDKDAYNARTLPYLGDIAMQNYETAMKAGYIPYARIFAQEAEHYFSQSIAYFPQGDLLEQSRFGLAWAQSRLGKYEEATALFRKIVYEASAPYVEKGYVEWGKMLLEQADFDGTLTTLATFERRFPNSELQQEVIRIRANAQSGLRKFDEALALLGQIKSPIAEDYLLNVRCLYGLRKQTEAEKALVELENSVLADSIKDSIQLQKAMLYVVKPDNPSTIALLEKLLGVKYNTITKKTTFTYYDLPTTTVATANTPIAYLGKLTEESFLKACAVLCVCYAKVGDWNKSDSIYAAMLDFAKPDDARQAHILKKMEGFLAEVSNNSSGNSSLGTPGTGTGNTAGTGLGGLGPIGTGNSGGQNIPISPSVEGGIDFGIVVLDKADLVPVGGSYDPNQENRSSSSSGSRNSRTSSRNSNSSNSSNNSNSSASKSNGSTTGSGSNSGSNSSSRTSSRSSRYGNQVSGDSENGSNRSEHQRMLQDSRNLLKNGKWEEADRKLLTLLGNNPIKSIGAEAALLRCEVSLQLGNIGEAETMSDLLYTTYDDTNLYAQSLWKRASYFAQENNSVEASQLYEIIVSDYPSNPVAEGALFHLGWDDLEAGYSRAARDRFMQIYKNFPAGDYWTHATWGLAYLAYKSDNNQAAEDFLQEVFNHPPDAAILDRTLFLKGELASRRGDYATAESAFRSLVKTCKNSPLVSAANARAVSVRQNQSHVAETRLLNTK